MSNLNFSKQLTTGQKLNFSKEFNKDILSETIEFNVRWNGRTKIDLDAWVFCFTGDGVQSVETEVVTERASLLGRLFGQKDKTETITESRNTRRECVDKIYSEYLSGGKLRNGYITHSGDNLGNNHGTACSELIKIDPKKIPENVHELYLGLTNFSSTPHHMITSMGIDITCKGKGLASYTINDIKARSTILGRLVRKDDGWELEVLNEGHKAKNMSDMARICKNM